MGKGIRDSAATFFQKVDPVERAKLSKGQNPEIFVVQCSDSR